MTDDLRRRVVDAMLAVDVANGGKADMYMLADAAVSVFAVPRNSPELRHMLALAVGLDGLPRPQLADQIMAALYTAGLCVVPILPNAAQRRAGGRAIYPPSIDFADEVYRVMLAASPFAPAGVTEGGDAESGSGAKP